MSEPKLAVTGIGMISSIGNTWEQSCAAQRTGLNQFLEYEDFFPENEDLDFDDQEPLIGARAPYHNTDIEENRAPKLILPALQELIHNANIKRDLFDEVDVLVTLSSGVRNEQQSKLKEEYKQNILKFSKKATGARELIRANHTGFPMLLSIAKEKMLKENKQCFVLLAIDSYHHPETLTNLDKNKRIKSKRSKDGFVPGEAAVAVLVETMEHANNRNAEIKAFIQAVSHFREENTMASDKPSTGNGLSSVIRESCRMANNFLPQWILNDLNGESYRAYEWGMVQVKLSAELKNFNTLWHPADCFGDVGAASGAVMLGVTVKAFEKDYAPARQSLICCSEDDGKRAAFVVAAA